MACPVSFALDANNYFARVRVVGRVYVSVNIVPTVAQFWGVLSATVNFDVQIIIQAIICARRKERASV